MPVGCRVGEQKPRKTDGEPTQRLATQPWQDTYHGRAYIESPNHNRRWPGNPEVTQGPALGDVHGTLQNSQTPLTDPTTHHRERWEYPAASKHSQATNLWVRMGMRDRSFVVQVEDDGIGFDVADIESRYDERGSLGMINLRERTELLGGQLRIESAPGKGTRVTLLVPLKDIAPRE